MHEKFIHGTQKFVYLLVYLTGGSSYYEGAKEIKIIDVFQSELNKTIPLEYIGRVQ